MVLGQHLRVNPFPHPPQQSRRPLDVGEENDFSPLPDVAEMFELLPDAQLAVLPGTTHVGVTRRPGELLALITPFLNAC